MDFKKNVGGRIRRAREELGLRLVDLSQRTGGVLTIQRINAYENGDRMPKQAEAVILAKALGKTAAYLMALTDSETPMTATEERLLRNWRTLNERERMEVFRHIEALAMASRDPVQDRVVERHIPVPKQIAHKRVKR
jgi:transcriptional regulator with XRE-family HTH domain